MFDSHASLVSLLITITICKTGDEMASYSVVEIRGYKYSYHCGYCNQNGKSSYGKTEFGFDVVGGR